MTKKEILQNLYQIQEFMGSGIFEVQVEEDDDIDENINEDLQEALDEVVIVMENIESFDIIKARAKAYHKGDNK